MYLTGNTSDMLLGRRDWTEQRWWKLEVKTPENTFSFAFRIFQTFLLAQP